MTTRPPQQVTQLLLAWNNGDPTALERLTPLVQKELHRLAKRYMRGERPGHILQTTALVNEAYVRLVDVRKVRWQNRAHFFAVAASLMRRILVDYARVRDQVKQGGGARHVPLDEALHVAPDRNEDFIAIDEALTCLANIDPRKSQIVELRFFGGLSNEEIAEVLKVSTRTVMREWSLAQAWLHGEVTKHK